MTLPNYSRAVLLKSFRNYEPGKTVVVVEYLKPTKEAPEPAYMVEVGPWNEIGAPSDCIVVPASYLAKS